MISPFYRWPQLYQLMMRIAHGSSLRERHTVISKMIRKGDKVLDAGCGEGSFAEHVKCCSYVGIDLNETFVEHGRSKGRDVRVADVEKFSAKGFDVVVLSDILHHVAPRHAKLLQKIRREARCAVIVCEPYDNPYRLGILNWLIEVLDNDGINRPTRWLDKESLREFYLSHGAAEVHEIGKSMVAYLPPLSTDRISTSTLTSASESQQQTAGLNQA